MKETRVLFIALPLLPIKALKKSDVPTEQWATSVSIPMGVLSIATYTEKYAQADFKVLDLNLEISVHMQEFQSVNWDDFLEKQLTKAGGQGPVNIVGISAIFNSQMGYLDSVSAKAKKIWPKAIIVAGGELVTSMYSYVLECALAIDAVAIGEGEKPFCGLVTAADRMKHLGEARGWMTKERVRSKKPPEMDLLYDLDEIPFLRYDLININDYQGRSRYRGEKQSKNIAISIMTTRGCPGRCAFCAVHSVHGRKLRCHSPDRILSDIRKLKQLYGANIILIEDDNFMANKQAVLKIMEGICKENMSIEVSNGLSIFHLDEEIIDAMKKAGLTVAAIAVDSGSKRVLQEILHKPYKDLSKVKEVVSLLRKKDMYIRAYFIIGFPGETKEDILESVRFMKEIGFNWVAIMIATPLPGSELYDMCKKNNLIITDNLEDLHYGKCNIKLAHSTPEEIERMRYLINLEVNFVENYDLRNDDVKSALTSFQDVISRVSNHAFAYYFASVCYQKLGEINLERQFLEKYYEIVKSSKHWAEYARYFNLPTKEPQAERALL